MSGIERKIRDYFSNLGYYYGMTPSNKEAAQDRLSGYIDAYKEMGCISDEEAEKIFDELTEDVF